MKTLSDFTGLYQLSKTLRFELKPIGKTLENIEKNGLLEKDQHRAESYLKVKEIIDEFHKDFIERSLKNFKLEFDDEKKNNSLSEYFLYYHLNNRDEHRAENLKKIQDALRKQIANRFTQGEAYKRLFGKELIKEDLTSFVKTIEEKQLVEEFKDFTTYFTGFYENRKNMYSADEKSTAIAYRLIHENLPKFIDNMDSFAKISTTSVADKFAKITSDFEEYLNVNSIAEMFQLDYYSTVLTQTQIDVYNAIIGGNVLDDGTKIQGLNEYINLYNQQQKDKNARLPKLKPLYKQILSDRNAISWLPEEFKTDNEMLENIQKCYNELEEQLFNGAHSLKDLLKRLNDYDLTKIYIRNDLQLTDISQKMFGSWNIMPRAIESDFVQNNPKKPKETTEKYEERKSKFVKSFDSCSIAYLNKCLDNLGEPYNKQIEDYFAKLGAINTDTEQKENLFAQIANAYTEVKDLLNTPYPENKNLSQDKVNVEKIRTLLEAIKDLQRFAKPLLGKGDEPEKDERFYGEFSALWEKLDAITLLYNKVRNRMTRKPYSTEKIKLNFEKNQLVYNWPKMEQGFIIKTQDNTLFYLAIPLSNGIVKEIKNTPKSDKDTIELMNYQQGKAGQMIQNLMIKNGKATKVNGRKIGIRIDDTKDEGSFEFKGKTYTGKIIDGSIESTVEGKTYTFSIDKNSMINVDLEIDKIKYLPDEINTIRKKGSYNSGNKLNKKELIKFIDFYKPLVCEYKKQKFTFKESKEYEDFKSFTDNIDNQAYSLTFESISYSQIIQLVDDGKLCLFQIYNKDFSPCSKGTPNMHTLYWRMLFDEQNLQNVIYKLNGQAEIFFRKSSISYEKPTHPANKPIDNKNGLNSKKQSTFAYDLIKNRRYTLDKFQFHVPITMNFKSSETDNINPLVNEYLKTSKATHVIGIDRGERHLLYLSLIDMQGNVKDQFSLNMITNEYKDKTGQFCPVPINYHDLLDKREGERDKARKSWQTIETIKELKEGYLSQVVHKIAQLIVEYNAIVVLEDLNFGFMRGRQKVEKQVYQKFEKMLIDKLNYLVDKKKNPNDAGGILHALQLTSKYNTDALKKQKQSGILFYVPAWNTSKMDPTTGFVNLLDTRYENIPKAKAFFGKFESIHYNADKKWFEFALDYDKFTAKAEGTQTRWTLCTQGTRIETFRNPEKNSNWDNKEIDLTEAFKKFLADYHIDINGNLKEAIAAQDKKEFFEGLLHLLKLTLQMRNSITGTETDYLVSPVANKQGEFYDSRTCGENLPDNADANGAYNIARKGLWAIEQIRQAADLKKLKLAISNKEWLQFAQKKPYLNAK